MEKREPEKLLWNNAHRESGEIFQDPERGVGLGAEGRRADTQGAVRETVGVTDLGSTSSFYLIHL